MKAVLKIGLVMLAVGALIGAGIAWQYQQTNIDDAFQEGMSYQESLEDEAVANVASMKTTLNTTTVDHSDTVDSDGAVSTTTTVTKTLYINNTDENRDATGLKISLYNPVTDTEGLHDNLETSDTDIYVTTSSGVTARLFRDGDYTSGVEIPDLEPKSTLEMTVTFELESAVAGTFQDGQSYDCSLYVIQTNANYADVIDFTLST